MGEEQSGWQGMSPDMQALYGQEESGNIMSGASMMGAPPVESQMSSFAQPSAVNGYPIFSSGQAVSSSPSGYANANPIDATPSVIQQQARANVPNSPMPMNPAQPAPMQTNPWNIKSSSQPGPWDYPMGQNTPPPKLNVL